MARRRPRFTRQPARIRIAAAQKMTASLHTFAAVVLALEMPVPVYWLTLHAPLGFWRRHVRAGYLAAVLLAWGAGDSLLYHFRAALFHGPEFPAGVPPVWTAAAGLALIAVDVFTLASVETELGWRRLVGHAELTGRGEMAARGLYRRLRHPRYSGMIAAVLGACLILRSQPLWMLGAVWLLAALATVEIEERELRRRFGPEYAAYAERVPALLPIRLHSRRAPRARGAKEHPRD